MTKGGSWRLREALAQVMGKHKHQKETRNGQQKQLLTVLVLTSILGLGAYVPRAQAEPITISGEDVKAEEGNEYGSGLNTEESINLSNGAIGNKDTGTASGNTLQVAGGTVTSENPGSNIFGGVIIHEDNTTTSTEDQVNGNTVTLGSTTLGSGATEYDGVSIFGGYLYDYTKEYLGSEEENENHLVSTEQFDVSGNTVTLEKVTVHDGTPVAVYGGAANVKGYSDYYGVYRDEAGNYTDWSYLSPLDVTATADASNNRVYIGTSAEAEASGTQPDSENQGTYTAVIGGYSGKGTTSNNQVVVRNSTLTLLAAGGYTAKLDANENQVTLSDITVSAKTADYYDDELDLVGGFSLHNGACYNTLTLTRVNEIESDRHVDVAGGLTGGTLSTQEEGDASYNTVYITDSRLATAAGGIAGDMEDGLLDYSRTSSFHIFDFQHSFLPASAIGNKVYIRETSSGATTISGGVYGGAAHKYASQNEVQFLSGYAAKVGGGYAYYDANDNTVTLGKEDYSTQPVLGNSLLGGFSEYGSAVGNKVTAYGATLGNEASQDTYVDLLGLNVYDLPVGVLAGGYNHRHVSESGLASAADSNEVQIYQSTIKNGITDIYGGLGTTSAKDNKVTLDNTAVTLGNSSMFGEAETGSGGWILGGVANEGPASGNQVSISGQKTELQNAAAIGGGLAWASGDDSNDAGCADQNQVSITGAKVSYTTQDSNEDGTTIFGGLGLVSASNNSLELNQAAADGAYMICGGLSEKGTVAANAVKLNQSTVSGLRYLWGGYSPYGRVSENKVTFTASTISGNASYIVGAYGVAPYKNTMSIEDTKIDNLAEVRGVYGTVYEGDDDAVYTTLTRENQLKITGNSEITFLPVSGTSLIGADATGLAQGNSLTVENSKVYNLSVLEGVKAEQNASENQLQLTNAEVSGLSCLIGVQAMGEDTVSGKAVGNTAAITGGSLSFTDGVLDSDGGYPSKPTLAAAYAGASAYKNSLALTNVKVNGAQEIYAGAGANQALENILKLQDATISGASVIAGGKSNGTTYYRTYDTFYQLKLLSNPGAYANQVAISGGNVTADAIYGGYLTTIATSDDLLKDSSCPMYDNQVTLGSGVTAGNVYGAYSPLRSYAQRNTVTVEGGTIQKNLVGGQTTGGIASGNILNIKGGTIGTTIAADEEENPLMSGNLIAAGVNEEGPATDNTVNITGGLLGSMMSLYGGYSTTESTGNTLNLSTKGNTVKNLGYFQNLNFYVPADAKAGDTMLEVTDTADVHGAAINAGVEDTTQLNPGEVINLIHDANNEINTTGTSYAMMDGKDIVTDAAFLQRKVYIKPQDANTIVLYVPIDSQPILHPDTEVIADGQANAASTVANGSDAAVTDGLQAALTAWAESHEAARLRDDDHNVMDMLGTPYISSPAGMSLRQGPVMAAASPLDAADAKNANVTLSAEEITQRKEREVEAKFTPYVMLGGHNLRYNSSSTVDTNGFNGELGFVKRVFKKDYADTIMPFIEYGTGNYTSYKNGTRGDGSQRYVGAGILLRRDQVNGVHYEGLVRAGRLNGDYAGRIAGYRTTYNSGAGYIAAHAGLGRIYRQATNDYNVYGKFFYSHLGGDSVTLHSSLGSADYDLDGVDSIWTRLGFRWTKHLDEATTTFYAGLGWDYEFDGKATARYRDYTTPDASMKGSSEFLELGWQSKVTKENPWGADVRVTGWHGVKQGFTYGVTITRRM